MTRKKTGVMMVLTAATILLTACSSQQAPSPEVVPTGSGEDRVLGVSNAMRGIGTDPFRGFTVEGNTLERRTIAEENGVPGIKTTTFVGMIQQSTGTVLQYIDTNDKIEITAQQEECISTTSEKPYEYVVTIMYDKEEFIGCGELAK